MSNRGSAACERRRFSDPTYAARSCWIMIVASLVRPMPGFPRRRSGSAACAGFPSRSPARLRLGLIFVSGRRPSGRLHRSRLPRHDGCFADRRWGFAVHCPMRPGNPGGAVSPRRAVGFLVPMASHRQVEQVVGERFRSALAPVLRAVTSEVRKKLISSARQYCKSALLVPCRLSIADGYLATFMVKNISASVRRSNPSSCET